MLCQVLWSGNLGVIMEQVALCLLLTLWLGNKKYSVPWCTEEHVLVRCCVQLHGVCFLTFCYFSKQLLHLHLDSQTLDSKNILLLKWFCSLHCWWKLARTEHPCQAIQHAPLWVGNWKWQLEADGVKAIWIKSRYSASPYSRMCIVLVY